MFGRYTGWVSCKTLSGSHTSDAADRDIYSRDRTHRCEALETHWRHGGCSRGRSHSGRNGMVGPASPGGLLLRLQQVYSSPLSHLNLLPVGVTREKFGSEVGQFHIGLTKQVFPPQRGRKALRTRPERKATDMCERHSPPARDGGPCLTIRP